MSNICSPSPYVGDEKSILYNELLEYTGNNRPLTNYIYTLAIQPAFVEKFTSSQCNRQGEVLTAKVIEALGVDSFIDAAKSISNAEKELGAKEYGENVKYETVEEIQDKVIEFNNRPDNKLRAVIKYQDGAYIIQVGVINADNFLRAESLEPGREQVNSIKNVLANAGLNTVGLSTKSLKVLNATNVAFFPSLFEKIRKIDKYTSEDQINLLLDLTRDIPQVSRFINKFRNLGVDPATVFKLLLSSDRGSTPTELLPYENDIWDANSQTLYTNALREMQSALAKVSISDLNNTKHTSAKVAPESFQISKTLKELYSKYNLDIETIHTLNEKITSMEALTSQVLARLQQTLNALTAKGYVSNEEKEAYTKEIKQIEKAFRNKQFVDGILLYTKNITDLLEAVNNEIQNTTIDQDTPLEGLNQQAKLIEMIQLEIQNALPVLKALTKTDSWEDLLEEDKTTLKDTVLPLLSNIEEFQEVASSKKFILTYVFLKKYWGSEDIKQSGTSSGLAVSLTESLKIGTGINPIDRFINSLTEVSDPVIATLGAAIKDMHEDRDDQVKKLQYSIRTITDELYRSGSDSSFMYVTDENGFTHLRSGIDWTSYYRDRSNYKKSLQAQGYSRRAVATKMAIWEQEQLGEVTYNFQTVAGAAYPVTLLVPKQYYSDPLTGLTAAQQTYYKKMMAIKYDLENKLHQGGIKTDLFLPVQMNSSMLEGNKEMSFKDALQQGMDNFRITENDTEYGITNVILDSEGNEIKSLPVFYINKLKDQSRLSKDFSKTLLAFGAMTENYSALNTRAALLEMTKSFLMKRQLRVGKNMFQVLRVGDNVLQQEATEPTSNTITGKYLEDLYDVAIYGRAHSKSKVIKGVSVSKTASLLTQYTSTTGLVMNVPGAIANALVGKLQMLIEAGAGEFWNMKDMGWATKQYYEMLPALMQQMHSPNNKSLLGAMMEEFDVMDDFYEKAKNTPFFKTPVGKLIGNSNLFFLYGMGEHLLHAQGMLACLKHTKVLNPEGKEVPLFEVFEMGKAEGSNAELQIKEGYTTKKGTPIDKKYIREYKKRVSYVNRSLHGAFGADEKGMIHRYAFGRLLMNFRQWMPAHYNRRFNTLHWDATLGDYREGYYITTAKFLYSIGKDLKNGQFTLLTQLDNIKKNYPMEYANLKRALTETILLMVLSLLSRLNFGDDPKHRAWWEALIKYEIKRMDLETAASMPANTEFFKNIITIVNSPIPSINTINRLMALFEIDDLIFMRRYESGPNKGELIYNKHLQAAIPFYKQVWKWWHMDTDDSMFKLFN